MYPVIKIFEIPYQHLLTLIFLLCFQYANLFENNSSSEWLLYISEWTQGSLDLSNIRVTTKVAVNALLGDTPTLQNYGSAIMHNLATKEVKAVVCILRLNRFKTVNVKINNLVLYSALFNNYYLNHFSMSSGI